MMTRKSSKLESSIGCTHNRCSLFEKWIKTMSTPTGGSVEVLSNFLQEKEAVQPGHVGPGIRKQRKAPVPLIIVPSKRLAITATANPISSFRRAHAEAGTQHACLKPWEDYRTKIHAVDRLVSVTLRKGG